MWRSPGLIGRLLALAVIAGLVAGSFVRPIREMGLEPGFMHGVHLVFHEAGHVIFGFLFRNEAVGVFMGSGMQVLVPLCVGAAFWLKNEDPFAASLCLIWAGHAALDVAPYIADARALELQLLGGGTGREVEGHDWEFLLYRWNALHLDQIIAARVALGARLAMAAGILGAAAVLGWRLWLEREK
ncbi:hypothetical protein [Nibricoccus sp. IMCC34717]|uniref:hypothetical protein n=1 Tax=Nibricoccus sp. IMCC34717 TaxID=3034021 RepID=UPI0038504987